MVITYGKISIQIEDKFRLKMRHDTTDEKRHRSSARAVPALPAYGASGGAAGKRKKARPGKKGRRAKEAV
jgi:hypothetical protein